VRERVPIFAHDVFAHDVFPHEVAAHGIVALVGRNDSSHDSGTDGHGELNREPTGAGMSAMRVSIVDLDGRLKAIYGLNLACPFVCPDTP
jgi:hypothetical protein